MKYVENGSTDTAGIAKAAGRYTAAWSAGYAVGPLVFGLLSAKIGFCICLAVGLLVSMGVLIIKNYYKKHKPAIDHSAEIPAETESDLPDFAWVGWIVAGIGTLTVVQVRTMLQPLGETLSFNITTMSWILFTVSFVQAAFALFLSITKRWMFKWLPALLIGLAGSGSLLMIVFSDKLPLFFAAAAIYGFYCGCFYFLFVYYSLLHPTKAARNAGVNEVVVAISGIIGPLLGGAIANVKLIYPFALSATLIACATILHVVMCCKAQRSVSCKN